MITTFGEIMLRISPKYSGERIKQAVDYKIEPGGSESNVAIALSNLGLETQFVSAIPDNQLSIKILQFLNQFKVNTKNILLKGNRLGIYWIENGVGPRASSVFYDRDYSSFSKIEISDIGWDIILKKSCWFHTSGISPAVSEKINQLLIHIFSLNDDKYRIPISIDLNYRSKLWKWLRKDTKRINDVMSNLCKYTYLICGNETDFKDSLGLTSCLKEEKERYIEIAQRCFNLFNRLKYVAVSNRKSLSASTNNWKGYLFIKDDPHFCYESVEIKLENIVDRLGTGDSFSAGIIYGLNSNKLSSGQDKINFAVYLSALNHTINGDASRFTESDVLMTIDSSASGRVIR